MAVTLRLVRKGRRHRPFYRLRASDSRTAPTGRFLEELGTVDPLEKDNKKQVILKQERIEYWLGQGATRLCWERCAKATSSVSSGL